FFLPKNIESKECLLNELLERKRKIEHEYYNGSALNEGTSRAKWPPSEMITFLWKTESFMKTIMTKMLFSLEIRCWTNSMYETAPAISNEHNTLVIKHQTTAIKGKVVDDDNDDDTTISSSAFELGNIATKTVDDGDTIKTVGGNNATKTIEDDDTTKTVDSINATKTVNGGNATKTAEGGHATRTIVGDAATVDRK
uniref:Uncharacterized protein n=1 Tax=Romanomermis culicivorax TaxID=13658 RepID=A0A915KIW2_ROMCU